MAIRVRDKGKDFIPPPSGLQRAVCCDVVELGMVETKFGTKRMIKLVWQSEYKMDDGKPFLIQSRYSATLGSKGGKKSNLLAALEGWRGKALTPEEADDFDLEVLIGKNCQILIVHNVSDGTTFGNVQSVVPPAKNVEKLNVSEYKRVQDREGYEPPVLPKETESGPGDAATTEEVVDDIPF